MDKEDLTNQMMEEEVRAGSLRRKHLTPEFTNDITHVVDPKVLLWRERTKEVVQMKCWNVPADCMHLKLKEALAMFTSWNITQSNMDNVKTKKDKMDLIDKPRIYAIAIGIQILQYDEDLKGLLHTVMCL